MDNIIEAIKEFFFDIIGFLLPGLVVLIVGKVIFKLPINFEPAVMIINIVVAYILGYLVFAISLIKELGFNKISEWSRIQKLLNFSSETQVLKTLSTSDTFKLASEIIKNKTSVEGISLKNYKSFRNVAMSGSPETDKKIYTFMFRAELFNQLHTISIIALIILLLSYFSPQFLQKFNTPVNEINFDWIFLFLLSASVLRMGWKRFYIIAMSLPFSVYLEKYKRQ